MLNAACLQCSVGDTLFLFLFSWKKASTAAAAAVWDNA